MDEIDRIKDLCRRMEDISFDAGLPPIDRVRLVSDPGEPDQLWFLWEERKLAVAVALDDDPETYSGALHRAIAGDPVMN